MPASYHARSNSLPSRQHPIISQIDENLNRLRASQSAATSSSIGHNLSGLQDLHECVDVLLQFPLTQQALAQEKQRKMVEELLDGYLMLLDVCTTAKDALLQTKECTQELQSILRRRRGAEGLANEFRKYLASRKAMKKAICMALKNLKHIQNKLNTPGENGAVISVLRDVEAVTISMLESVLSLISGPEAESKSSRWSLVSKLMHKKKKANEILSAEAAVHSCIKSEDMKHVENVQKELQSSELSIQDLEEGLETLSRRMIKTRNQKNGSHSIQQFPRSSRQHPLATEVNEHLNRLRASKEASTSSSSISHKLNGFQDLYDCVVEFLQFPLSYHALAHECADELLDGSLRLLDLCITAKDIVLQTKENASELQSALHRRKIGEAKIVSEVRKYMSSRKVSKKTIHKVLGNFKVIQWKNTVSPSKTVSMLKEIEAVTCSMFEDLLSLISGPKPGSWLSVSKLLHQRRIVCEDVGRNVNEFEKDLEDELECLFRCMIKARVSLLNILTL
ncbi:DUF241 domain protein [Gossypium australe]|uniref:DUF241 domain protein n=1 Tax=Gossypium australe TaxID=47621 RepID=A0A5B6UXF0_9ROSI|nr:DUF241 domain protein [Gossypium australe]